MTRAPDQFSGPKFSGGVIPSAPPERGAALPSPPSTHIPFCDAFIEANRRQVDPDLIAEKLTPIFLAEHRAQRGMPVVPRVDCEANDKHLTPVQRLAQRKPGIPGHDSYAPPEFVRRGPDDPLSPQDLLHSPVFDLRWLGWSSLITGGAAALLWWLV